MQGAGIRRCVVHAGRLTSPPRMLATLAAQGKVERSRRSTGDAWPALESAWRVAHATPMMAGTYP
jgi:hypothetical protein